MHHLVYQLEKAPSTGQLHIQGVAHFTNPIRMAGAKALLGGDTVHVEPCRNYTKAVEYCKKEETRIAGPWEHGRVTSQGTRTDLQSAVAMVLGGKRPREIAREEPVLYARFSKNLQALRQELEPARQRDNIKVILLWGTTRTGKTRSVYDLWNVSDVYRVFDTKTPWMDGYSDQKIALLDDYGEGMMNIHYLKNLLDRYAMDVPVKGGRVAWNPEVIIITSNGSPETWYPTAREDDLDALKARMEAFHFPSQKEAALARLKSLIPCRHQEPVAPPAIMPIQIDSASETESESGEEHLSDLVAPSWDMNLLEEE